jgi:hypothetical protein
MLAKQNVIKQYWPWAMDAEPEGIDAHAIKREFLGTKNISKFDLYRHNSTGEILIMQKGGRGDAIFTGYFAE